MGRKVLSAFLILVVVFSNGFLTLAQIALAAPTGENKTFYFRNQSAQLPSSHVLSTTAPTSGNSQNTSITSTDSPSFRHFHPGITSFQHIFATEPAHTLPVDLASWISDVPLDGTFQAGSWKFIVHKNDNIKGEVSVPHFNVYKSPSNTSLDQATFLFDVEGPDWWTSSDEQLNFSTPLLSQFEFNNAYLVVQLFDQCKSGCNGGKIMTVFEDGTSAATQTRIETPLFVPAGSNEPVPPPSAPAPEPSAPQPPTPPADITAPIITILGDSPVTVFLGSTYIDAGATAIDNIDGAISVETTNAVNTAVLGGYSVIYKATDSAGNTSVPAIRTVNVVAPPAPVLPPPAPIVPPLPPLDTIAPVITMLGSSPLDVTIGSVYNDAGATALDNIDGDLAAKISASGLPINTASAGTFTITYNVADSAGNTATPVTRIVNVIAAPEEPAAPAPEPPPPPVQPSAPKNSPPVVEPIPSQTITVGTPVSFKVIATDTDGDALTYSLGPNAPLGATIDPKTGAFFWLPQVVGTTNFDILVSDGVNTPVTTGHLIENRNLGVDGILGTADDIFIGGMATWGMVKAQARDFLGILLDDLDVLDLPLLATDAYGNFIKGPNGFPQLVIDGGLLEGNPASPVDASKAVRTHHPFIVDISHNANPVNSRGVPLKADSDNVIGLSEPGTYDNELLDAHFMAGDGRVNENIGLTAVHHIFHSEHNRLVEYAKNVILDTGDLAFLSQWLVAGSAPDTFPQTPQEITALSWNGERLFQVAKFGTEMQYQHLVFEEFARKVSPQVNIFSGYDNSIDPAIMAEFAHTVYRFGHSLLTDTVARTNEDGTTNDIGLIQAFLNPLEFVASGDTPIKAAGAIVSGMVNQVGNEIDEFVTESLRSNLLGLPLDLATINLARGRDTGVPPLNSARKQFFMATGGDSSLKPYTSWVDFGLNIKHPLSLINFIAAYGTHPTVLNAASLQEKRAAAALLVDGGEGAPEDRVDFLNSTGNWVSTGLDTVDFWIGGLAEKQMPFGGLLGPTFNFVFETQMEKLQDGDRFYYLFRNAGLNFLTSLEQNSFAELVMRNTEGVKHTPHDIFSHPAFTIEAADIDPLNPATFPPDTIIMPDGTIRYTGVEHIVMGGTAGNDKLHSSEGDDTLWGDEGNDRLEGGAGNDAILGGAGDDILTDIFGDDNIKGGEGNDVINAGVGIDLILGGDGQDFVVAGRDSKETFGGAGNDFIIAGDGADTVFGNEGDDWIEGGDQADLLQGDNGDPFQSSPTIGNDVIIGGGGNDDYDSESGDDIMLADPGIERNEGMLGFDWVIYKNDPQPANADMFITGLLPPTVNDLRDRFDLVEGLSGGSLDDILRGDNRTSVGFLDHALNNPAQIALINGLQNLLGDGVSSFSGGNIILGGAGSDVIEGRGGDDLIDGDAWLNVRLSVGDISADSMTELQTAMFEGKINPGQIKIIREILTSQTEDDIDTAVFSGNLADYTISQPDALGRITVTDNRREDGGGGRTSDGTDTLRNIERLQFADQTIDLNKSNKVSAPALVDKISEPGVSNLRSGVGLTLIRSDLQFILDQIKIAEAHAQGAFLSGLIPKDVLPWGLRTVDGTFNNIVSNQSEFGAADRVFPRLTTPVFRNAENATFDLDGPGPLTLGQPTSYAQNNGFVFDSQPRLISNLIVDQTLGNPAAQAASAFSLPDPQTNSLFIPNIAPDMGLSASFNSWFTLFGQFFDHGLDLVNKGGSGTVFIPLATDDPLFNPASPSNFMVLTRATNQPGPDGVLGTLDDIHEHTNQTSPFIDQNQTYTSHPSHQVFLRSFNFRPANSLSVLANITVAPKIFSVFGQGKFTSTNGQTITPKVVSQGISVVSVEDGGGIHSVTVPDGTEITKSNGKDIDITALTAAVPAIDSLTGMNKGVVVNGKLQWGIPNQGLLFSNPISLDIFVGTDLNGQTLDVLRSETGTGNWTNEGIVAPATCLVANGMCTFQATKASVYIAAQTVASAGGTIGNASPTDNNNSNNTPTNTSNTATNTNTISSSSNSFNSSSSNGSSTPSNASAPVCTDSKPGSAPKLLSAIVTGPNQVTLSWSKAQNPATYYLVAYGTSSENLQFGNPNVGGADTTSYVVNGLSGGTAYYFKVRAGNNCMPGEFSNELPATVDGSVIRQPASGFTEGVLGVKKETLDNPTIDKPALAPTTSESRKNRIFQLTLAAMVLLAISYGLFYRLAKRVSRRL
ncbi:MAG: DUF5011 domain-containing protein [Candidatus Blackburnbacteria bacterium]|nr:DUF5011 domain-containing protein [Candidatus Blackburnbacteria bacterium]